MDKNAIKKYAVWARRELISRVSQKAQQFGITEKNIVDAGADSVNGHLLSADEKKQRQALIARIKSHGFEQVMEEVAYTWFNRFSALRFMEANGYLPTRVRVFTDESGAFKPQIIAEAIHLELDGLDMDKVYALKEKNDDEALFKYLLITQCNALSAILPGMFQRISDYTELLFPDNLLRSGSVLEQMISLIPEEDWKDQVQIIGWLYQYYNTEPKDKVFADLKKNIKISKENIPAATQLFTPDWIVRYMVENSLGRIYINKRKNEGIFADGLEPDEMTWEETEGKRIANEKYISGQMGWKYYLPEAEQEPDVQAQLEKIHEEYENLKPEEIRCIDPCMGSGHILVYMFDVLMSIYEAYGYRSRDAVASIVRNNLYGLDIDDRAAQLAYFSVMMKARQYDSRFFTRGVKPNVYAICESNGINSNIVDYFVNGDAKLKESMDSILTEMRDAKEYGSILNITTQDWTALYARFDEVFDEISMFKTAVLDELLPVVRVAEVLVQKYDTVCTNPPYMGASGMGAKLGEYVKKNYPDSKSDMSTVCMEKALSMCTEHSYMAMINIPVWMFLSSYEKLRKKMIAGNTFINMVHPGRGIFGSDFGTTTFVIGKAHITSYVGSYRRLFEKQGEVETIEQREQHFFEKRGRFTSAQDNFSKIPGAPIAYWASKNLLHDFIVGKRLDSVAKPKQGVKTADKDRFLRFWHEVSFSKIAIQKSPTAKWFPCNKGGNFRKWYGNNEYVVNWENNGYAICNFRDENGKLKSRPQNLQYMLKEGLTYTNISISSFGVRYSPVGFVYDAAGSGIFCENREKLLYVLAFLTSTVAASITKITSPTMSFEVGQISSLPFIYHPSSEVDKDVLHSIELSKNDWDSFETSWDFKRHPLVRVGSVAEAYSAWEQECNDRFNQLKSNEEELNRIFIDIYGLRDELTPEVEDKDVTVRLADKKRDIRSLISYAVGCMFGRYSLDEPGLILAGYDRVEHTTKTYDGDDPELEKFAKINADDSKSYGSNYHWVNQERFKSFPIDVDNIIPICDDEYFDDDITGRFVKFIETVYGKETLDENLRFIADALGGSGQPKDVIRNYFLNDFYADHLKIYQKRPIYWLFDSGKKNGFKALIYMHRYAPDTIARMRTDYVHEQQARYRTAIADLGHRIDNASTAERVKLNKQLAKLQGQADELCGYEEKIHHLADQMIRIDLDDGVKHNYEIFGDVLAKIK